MPHRWRRCHPEPNRKEGMDWSMLGRSRQVTGGVDTHLDVNVAAVLDGIGGLLGVESFPTTPEGHRRLLEWMAGFGRVAQVGVEGTGSYGASLSRFLAEAGVEVLEVDRPNRQERRRKGKNDTVDAIEAARAAQGQRQLGVAKTKDGNVEAIRALLVAKRSARDMKIATLNQIRHLGFTAPEEIRQSLQGVSRRLIAKKAGGPSRAGQVSAKKLLRSWSSTLRSASSSSTRRPKMRRAVLVAKTTGSPSGLGRMASSSPA